MPMLIRVGGTNADATYYDLSGSKTRKPSSQAGYSFTLHETALRDIFDFVSSIQAPVVFGINAGPGPRNGKSDWQPENFVELLQFANNQGFPFYGLEFGNEPNLFFFAHNLIVSGDQFGKDFQVFVQSTRSFYSGIGKSVPLLISTDIAYQIPVVGPIDPYFMPAFASRANSTLFVALLLTFSSSKYLTMSPISAAMS